MSLNLDRHVSAHWDLFDHLVEGDGDSAAKHRAFYDEYLAVMDLTAEFYLQTVRTVFIEHALPRGEMCHRGMLVDLGAIRRCALMAVEGEQDDISGVGQTRAALDLSTNLPDDKKAYHLQAGAGHYGVFNGSRFRAEIAPEIAAFMARNAREAPQDRQAARNNVTTLDPALLRVPHGRADAGSDEPRVITEPAASQARRSSPEQHSEPMPNVIKLPCQTRT